MKENFRHKDLTTLILLTL